MAMTTASGMVGVFAIGCAATMTGVITIGCLSCPNLGMCALYVPTGTKCVVVESVGCKNSNDVALITSTSSLSSSSSPSVPLSLDVFCRPLSVSLASCLGHFCPILALLPSVSRCLHCIIGDSPSVIDPGLTSSMSRGIICIIASRNNPIA